MAERHHTNPSAQVSGGRVEADARVGSRGNRPESVRDGSIPLLSSGACDAWLTCWKTYGEVRGHFVLGLAIKWVKNDWTE
jgi:hypothetical protein